MQRTGFSGTVLHAKNRFFLYPNTDKNVSPKEFINKLLKKSPVVYGSGGYLVSPVNSFLSYLARIHCSLRILWIKVKI